MRRRVSGNGGGRRALGLPPSAPPREAGLALSARALALAAALTAFRLVRALLPRDGGQHAIGEFAGRLARGARLLENGFGGLARDVRNARAGRERGADH